MSPYLWSIRLRLSLCHIAAGENVVNVRRSSRDGDDDDGRGIASSSTDSAAEAVVDDNDDDERGEQIGRPRFVCDG
jgi:hypothetical protein